MPRTDVETGDATDDVEDDACGDMSEERFSNDANVCGGDAGVDKTRTASGSGGTGGTSSSRAENGAPWPSAELAGVEGVIGPLDRDAVPLECLLLFSSQFADTVVRVGEDADGPGLSGADSP